MSKYTYCFVIITITVIVMFFMATSQRRTIDPQDGILRLSPGLDSKLGTIEIRSGHYPLGATTVGGSGGCIVITNKSDNSFEKNILLPKVTHH